MPSPQGWLPGRKPAEGPIRKWKELQTAGRAWQPFLRHHKCQRNQDKQQHHGIHGHDFQDVRVVSIVLRSVMSMITLDGTVNSSWQGGQWPSTQLSLTVPVVPPAHPGEVGQQSLPVDLPVQPLLQTLPLGGWSPVTYPSRASFPYSLSGGMGLSTR
jgi:hypothetical protein